MSDIVLSRELEEQAMLLRALASGKISNADALDIADEIGALGKVAHALERELQVHRLLEAGRKSRHMVEQLASSTALPHVRNGNVIAPDFGRRS